MLEKFLLEFYDWKVLSFWIYDLPESWLVTLTYTDFTRILIQNLRVGTVIKN